MFFTNHNFGIIGTGSHTPSTVITNREIEKRVETSSDWILSTLGIEERRVALDDEMTSDLAYFAAVEAIRNARIDKNDIDLIIVATSTADRKAPSTACIVQERLEINNHCPAFDITAVCSGFLYALTIAGQFIGANTCRNALVIGADTFSKITDWNRRDCVFFGDGAGAVVVSHTPKYNLFSSLIFSDGTGKDSFTVYPGEPYFSMTGKDVFRTATTVLPSCISEVLHKNNVSLDDITWVIPHQPSIGILRKTAKVLGIPFTKVKTNMDRYANTSGATIPLLLDEVNKQGELSSGDLIVFAAVGSGWTWGASVYQWL